MALDRIMVGGRTAASIALLVWIEIPSVITSKAANDYHFKTGQRK